MSNTNQSDVKLVPISTIAVAKTDRSGCSAELPTRSLSPHLFGIGVVLVLPVFFQIDGGLFRDPATVYDSGGDVSRLPLPVSVLALFSGIALIGTYATAARTLRVLFSTTLLLAMTTFAAALGYSTYESSKLAQLVQFLLPMFGLVLGEMYGSATQAPVFERAALCVLCLIIPTHLLATWTHGYPLLQPSVYIFSIYQHLQYFPMVVAALGLMVSFGLWMHSRWTRWALTALIPVLSIHAVASQSLAAMTCLGAGLMFFAYVHRSKGRFGVRAVLVVFVALMAGAYYGVLANSGWLLKTLNSGVTPDSTIQTMEMKFALEPLGGGGSRQPLNVTQRFEHWRFYTAGVLESPSTFLMGHRSPPDRNEHPSAHNYWLDGVYNFGVGAFVPLFVLLYLTAALVWAKRKFLVDDPLLLGALVACAYLVLGENMLKVGMRQPYPGIITFFIWGLLIARLSVKNSVQK